MRPEIPESLADRVEEVYDTAGYTNRGELVRDAVRRRIEELENNPKVGSSDHTTFSGVIQDAGGIEFGVNPVNDESVVIDRFEQPTGYNQLIAGAIRSGKTVSAKLQVLRELRARDDLKVVIIDPLEGYVDFAEEIGGQRVVVGGNVQINPLEISEPPDTPREVDGHENYDLALQRGLDFFERYVHMRGGQTSPEDEEVLSRAIERAYEAQSIDRNRETHSNTAPTVGDVLDVLGEMARHPAWHADHTIEPQTDAIANSATNLMSVLHPLVEGGDHENLNGPTELSVLEDDLTYLDISQQKTPELTGCLMQLLLNTVYEQAKHTDDKVLILVDEARYLFDAPSVGYLETMMRHARHFDTGITLVRPPIGEMVGTAEGKAIVDNCSLIQLHRMDIDSVTAASLFSLDDDQIEFVHSASTGDELSEALLCVNGEWMPIEVAWNEDESPYI